MNPKLLILGVAATMLAGCSSQHELEAPAVTLHKATEKEIAAAAVTTPEVPEPRAAAWIPPPNDLPADFVAAVQFLQSHGLADPRGGKFVRAYTSRLLNWDSVFALPVMRAGWIAEQADGKTRLAGEDGLAESAWSGERPLKLDAYAHQVLPQRSSQGQKRPLDREPSVLDQPGTPGNNGPIEMLPAWDVHGQPIPTDRSVTTPPEMFAAMLLIDGDVKSAKRVLSDYPRNAGPIFVSLSTDLIRAKWLRALEAYGRGQDRSALDLLSDLETVRGACEAKIGRPSFDFLRQEPELAADISRRLNQRSMKDQSLLESRIAALENLASLSGAQTPAGQASAAVLSDLYDVGIPAIEPLFHVVDSDSRLTRQIVTVGGDPHVLTVREAALRVLNALTGASFHEDREGKLPSGAKLAQWWSKNQKLSVGEREFGLLADNGGDALQWIFAAKQISGLSPALTKVSTVEQRWSQLRLKTHKDPSVSQLMTTRMDRLLQDPSWPGSVIGAKVMEQCLETWDSGAATSILPAFSNKLALAESGKNKTRLTLAGEPYDDVDPDLTQLLERRIAAGDGSAMPEYRQLLIKLASTRMYAQPQTFAFLYAHQDIPAMATLTKQLFLDPVTATPPAKIDPADPPLVSRLASSPLANLPAVQDALIILLQNPKPHDSAAISSDGHQSTDRVCDDVAERLLAGQNSFRVDWPEKQKNAMENSLVQTLRRHPKRLWPRDFGGSLGGGGGFGGGGTGLVAGRTGPRPMRAH